MRQDSFVIFPGFQTLIRHLAAMGQPPGAIAAAFAIPESTVRWILGRG